MHSCQWICKTESKYTNSHVDQDCVHGFLPLFYQLIVVRFDNLCSFIPDFRPLFLGELLLESLFNRLGP